MTRPGGHRRRAHALLVEVGLMGVLAAAWALPQPVRSALVSETYLECVEDAAAVGRALLESYERST